MQSPPSHRPLASSQGAGRSGRSSTFYTGSVLLEKIGGGGARGLNFGRERMIELWMMEGLLHLQGGRRLNLLVHIFLMDLNFDDF